MRINREQSFSEVQGPHAGSLLLAHPRLLDPNFCRTVTLLSVHSEREGSVGVILNRAMGQTLGEYDPDWLHQRLPACHFFLVAL